MWNNIATTAIALSATLWQGCESRKYNRLSVLPVLMITKSIYHGDIRQLSLSNNGNGPAIITNMSIYVEDQEVPGGWESILELLKVKYEINIIYHYVKYNNIKLEKGEIFALDTGKIVPLIFVKEKYFEDVNFKEQFVSAIDKIKVVIKYRSVYDDSDKFKEIYLGDKYE